MPSHDTVSSIHLPTIPGHLTHKAVAAWSAPIEIDTYLPDPPSTYPAYLHARVYQGSSGRVFPLPFHDRIQSEKRPHTWQAVHLENSWMRLMILPELGGRIHIAFDKVAGYDIFYRNNVIKPALVGLAGPWISGGVEFNWPQHHRPATFLPTDVEIEEEGDGSVTVWCSDHDPFARMKGMHGIRLRPDSSVIEARVRLYNRSDVPQTFLWWANVAVAVGDDYQSFFPDDVDFVADHAKRAITRFPAADRPYYGIDYPKRAAEEGADADRLDWYRNIPVPTSYMVTDTRHEFFGGYDHRREAGFVHWAPRDISPGKKQWTWGDAPFGHAWDRNLTDTDGPYIELMAGVYTDNQPDFAWIAPGETKAFSQYWYPIHEIGPVSRASQTVAVSCSLNDGLTTIAGVACVPLEGAQLELSELDGRVLLSERITAAVGAPWAVNVVDQGRPLRIELRAAGSILLSAVWPEEKRAEVPTPAVVPPAPSDVGSIDELVAIGTYLDQYRHATRSPEPYWLEGQRRDPGDVRCATALGARRFAAGRFDEARELLTTAVERSTAWAPTPRSGESHYRLGLTYLRLGRESEAEKALARASWDAAWFAPAAYSLARLRARNGDNAAAEAGLRTILAVSPQHAQARALLVTVLRRGNSAAVLESGKILGETLAADPLDQWARHLAGIPLSCDAPTLLDVALELAGAGEIHDALIVLEQTLEASRSTVVGQVDAGPMALYHRAVLLAEQGDDDGAARAVVEAESLPATYAAASRLDDVSALEHIVAQYPRAARAALLLGNWHYSVGRVDDAVHAWTRAAEVSDDSSIAVVAHRNLGLAAYNDARDSGAALSHYEAALALAPADASLLREVDQLLERRGESVQARLDRLLSVNGAVSARDDLTIVVARLLVDVGRAADTRELLTARAFQPWEGGEGFALAVWDAAHLEIAREKLQLGRWSEALAMIDAALDPPHSLGEARHPLANCAELYLVRGDALSAGGNLEGALRSWLLAASAQSDFARMSTQQFSVQTASTITALARLGRLLESSRLREAVLTWCDEQQAQPAEIDYFATSLPTMLLFVDDPTIHRDLEVDAIRRAASATASG